MKDFDQKEFYNQMEELYTRKSEEMLTSFTVALEQTKDEFRVYQDQINTLNTNMVEGFKSQQDQINTINVKLDSVIEVVGETKQEVTFIKDYLETNLEPRVSILEKVTVKN
jgi:hypothetical protein